MKRFTQVLALAAVVAVLPLSGSPALACSLAGDTVFQVATPPMLDASVQLSTPRVRLENIRRGMGPQPQGAGFVSSSCDDIGMISIAIENDDSELGYVFEIDGVLPEGLQGPSEPLRPVVTDGVATFYWHWGDENTDVQEPFDFELVVVAIDANGNRSKPSEPLRIVHAGSSSADAVGGDSDGGVPSMAPESSVDGDGGCSAAGAGSIAMWPALMLTLTLVRRRHHA